MARTTLARTSAGPGYPHIVATPETCGGDWRIEGHRLRTKTISDSADNMPSGEVARWYQISDDLVMEAWMFEHSLEGFVIRLQHVILEELSPILVPVLDWLTQILRKIPPLMPRAKQALRVAAVRWRQ